ncbi:unnamed protein product, partial [marine sediment metagenome]
RNDPKFGPEEIIIPDSSEKFDVAKDMTDHFWFECSDCGDRAVVTKVWRQDSDRFAGIHFGLWCHKCGNAGKRKIYLYEIEEH